MHPLYRSTWTIISLYSLYPTYPLRQSFPFKYFHKDKRTSSSMQLKIIVCFLMTGCSNKNSDVYRPQIKLSITQFKSQIISALFSPTWKCSKTCSKNLYIKMDICRITKDHPTNICKKLVWSFYSLVNNLNYEI